MVPRLDGAVPRVQLEEAEARLVTGSELAVIRARIDSKYRFGAKMVKLIEATKNRIKGERMPYADLGVAISPMH